MRTTFVSSSIFGHASLELMNRRVRETLPDLHDPFIWVHHNEVGPYARRLARGRNGEGGSAMDDGRYSRLKRLVWRDSEHEVPLQEVREPRHTCELYLILYPKELEDDVIELLEAIGVPGYTELPKLVGRGRRIRHFDNPIWPGATGGVFTVLSQDQSQALTTPFEALAERMDSRSHGLNGLHMFALPCRSVI